MLVARTGGFPQLPSPNFEGHQPPGYYYVAAAVARVLVHRVPAMPGPPAPGDPRLANLHHARADLCVWCAQRSIHALRGVSSAFGLLTLIVTYLVARTAFPGRRWLAVGAAATAGFIPQFAYVSALVNNDAAAAAACGVALWGAVGIAGAEEPHRARMMAVVAGAGVGAGLLMKESALATLPAIALAAVIGPAARRDLFRVAGMAAGAAVLVSGWYLVRNLLLYRQPWPLAAERANVARLMDGVVVPRVISDPYFTVSFPREMFQSFWYSGGWGQVRLAAPLYLALAVVSAAAVLGALGALCVPRLAGLEAREHRGLAVLTAALVSAVAASVYYNLTYQQPQGRHMFWAIAAIAVVFVAGLRVLGGRHLGPWLAALLPAGLFVLSLYTLLVTYHAFWG